MCVVCSHIGPPLIDWFYLFVAQRKYEKEQSVCFLKFHKIKYDKRINNWIYYFGFKFVPEFAIMHKLFLLHIYNYLREHILYLERKRKKTSIGSGKHEHTINLDCGNEGQIHGLPLREEKVSLMFCCTRKSSFSAHYAELH